jgi:hypothetical protein
MIGIVSKIVTAENQWSDWMEIWGKFNVSISGISGDTIHVQRSKDGGTTTKDVKAYTSDQEESGEEIERGWKYRIGCKTGGYDAGTVLCALSF